MKAYIFTEDPIYQMFAYHAFPFISYIIFKVLWVKEFKFNVILKNWPYLTIRSTMAANFCLRNVIFVNIIIYILLILGSHESLYFHRGSNIIDVCLFCPHVPHKMSEYYRGPNSKWQLSPNLKIHLLNGLA